MNPPVLEGRTPGGHWGVAYANDDGSFDVLLYRYKQEKDRLILKTCRFAGRLGPVQGKPIWRGVVGDPENVLGEATRWASPLLRKDL